MKTYRFIFFLTIFCSVYSYAVEGKDNLIQKLEKGERVKIVTLGTSLTGGKWRWSDVMMEWLNKDYPGQVTLINLGVGASASMTVPAMKGNKYIWNRCGLDRVNEAVTCNPDVVFIEFTVNDAYKPYGISVEQSRKNHKSMINLLKEANPEVEIILQTMNVVIDISENNSTEATKRADITEYIEMYRQIAKISDLLLIDHYPNWKRYMEKNGKKKYSNLVIDGVHPNLEGYRMILLPELKMKLLKEE